MVDLTRKNHVRYTLTHEQQQKAVEQIQELMAQGMSSGEAIQIVAKALREIHQKGEKEASDSK